jgi:hypothetical protein
MSNAIVGKETLSYRKQKIAQSIDGPSLPQRIQFAHKFTGGEGSFSLLNLVTPTLEMPGFANPAPTVLAGAGINANPASLRLYISVTGGRLLPFDSYKVFGTTIQFLGALATGIPAGTIVFGEVDLIAANPIVIGDGRFVRRTYSLASGQTSLNLGFTYKVGTGLTTSDQIGDIKVYRNGQLQLRNVGNAAASTNADGNYQEIDAGNGYGAAIAFNSPPVGQADAILVEMGYQVSPGSVQVFSELERLQGGLQALAVDAAQAFGNPVGNYLSANATEMDRRSFGDSVLAASSLSQALDAEFTTLSATSTNTTGANGLWNVYNGANLSLGVGTWRVKAPAWFMNNGSGPTYLDCFWGLFAANGTGTSTRPALVSTLPNVKILNAGPPVGYMGVSTNQVVPWPFELIIQVTSGVATIYSCNYATASNGANSIMTAYINAERIKRS